MTKKKVFVDLFYLNTALTGIRTYMLEFCEAAKAFPSEEVIYIFSHDPQKQANNSFFLGNVARWRKLIYHLYYFVWKQLILPFKVKKSGADVLLCFDFIAPAFPLNAKKLVVVHDAFFWQMPQNYNPIWRSYFIPMIHAGLKGHTTVITTSHSAKKSLKKSAGIHQKIEVIYQCPKLLSTSVEDRILEKLGVHEKSYFLHVGSFDKRKRIPILVTAFAEIEKQYPGKYSLVLVGEKGLSPALDDYGQVVQKIKENSLEQNVLLPGFLPDSEVKALYNNAFAYVFPSSNEGFGIPVIEAMRSGIPVIISNQEALLEIAGEAACIHELDNPMDLAVQMKELIEKPALIEALILKGQQRAKVFSREAFLSGFLNLIKDIG